MRLNIRKFSELFSCTQIFTFIFFEKKPAEARFVGGELILIQNTKVVGRSDLLILQSELRK